MTPMADGGLAMGGPVAGIKVFFSINCSKVFVSLFVSAVR